MPENAKKQNKFSLKTCRVRLSTLCVGAASYGTKLARKKVLLVEKGGEKGKWEKVTENYWEIVEKEKEREKGRGKKVRKDGKG